MCQQQVKLKSGWITKRARRYILRLLTEEYFSCACKLTKQSSNFTGSVIVYSVSISVWFVLWLIIGDRFWWLSVLNRIVPYLFIPALLFLVWGLFTRRYRSIIPLLLPVLIFGGMYHPYLIPRLTKPAGENPDLKVMTYNVLYSNFDYDTVANVVLAYQPDLVALQEVQPGMMSALQARLADEYPYSLMGTENEYGTTAVFSRYAFTDSYVLDLQADRPAVVVKTNIGGHPVTFVAVHLLAYNLWWTKWKDIPAVVAQRTARQNRQAEVVLGQVEDFDGIVIVGCDCNSYETSSSYRIFDRSMNNSARETGWVLGEAELGTALQQIDYVWYRGSLKPIWVNKLRDSDGSDHFPVLSAFQMK